MGRVWWAGGEGDPEAGGAPAPGAVEAEVARRAGGRLSNVVERMAVRHEAGRARDALREAGLEPVGGPAARPRLEGALVTLVYLLGQGLGDTAHLVRTLEGEIGVGAGDAAGLADLVDASGIGGEDAAAVAAWALAATPLGQGAAEPVGTGAALQVLGVHALVAAEVMRDPAMPLLARQHLLIEVMGEHEVSPAAP
ncbi:MAG: hypothetical protein MUE51_07600 [Thermoleophilia bacterium]|jgi:hypothetical protein|nr:hypothetical protein [Thermoleophilia bacterium]